MLIKTILKKVINVKHTAIDDLSFNADGSITIKVHPTKGEQCCCGLCCRKCLASELRRARGCVRPMKQVNPTSCQILTTNY